MCSSLGDFQSMLPQKKSTNPSSGATSGSSSGTKATTATAAAATAIVASSATTATAQKECPPDVNQLGRATWTFLHSLAATYPEKASPAEQKQMSSFLGIFSNIYPCWHCAEDFRDWVSVPENKPALSGRDAFGNWLCVAHNEVNQKIGKPEFDCKNWKYRWVDGWPDGSCK